MQTITRRIEIEGVDIAITTQKELREAIKLTNKAIDEVDKSTPKYQKLNNQLVYLREVQKENRRENRELGKTMLASGEVATGAYRKLSMQFSKLKKEYKDLRTEGKHNTKQGRELLSQIQKLDVRIKSIDKSVGESFRNVGNYQSALGGIGKKIAGFAGAYLSIQAVLNVTKQLITNSSQLAKEAQGVNFAFERVAGSAKALRETRDATRGMISDLDIKRGIVEFDNFNISQENTATLFEFLAVRATQTGKSIDKLKDSLVEGLSKESKLRIDNLGISAVELNEELERTPDFVQAVANIATREIAESGNILDSAAGAQAKWNAALSNFMEIMGSRVLLPAINAMYNFGNSILEVITPTRDVTEAIREEQTALNVLVQRITDANTSEEDRAKYMQQVTDKFPNLLDGLDKEKTSNEDLLERLNTVNESYVTRIALTELANDADNKAIEAGKKRAEAFRQETEAREALIKAVGSQVATDLLQENTLYEALKLAEEMTGLDRAEEFNRQVQRQTPGSRYGSGASGLNAEQKAIKDGLGLLELRNKALKEAEQLTESATSLEERKNEFLKEHNVLLEVTENITGDKEDKNEEELEKFSDKLKAEAESVAFLKNEIKELTEQLDNENLTDTELERVLENLIKKEGELAAVQERIESMREAIERRNAEREARSRGRETVDPIEPLETLEIDSLESDTERELPDSGFGNRNEEETAKLKEELEKRAALYSEFAGNVGAILGEMLSGDEEAREESLRKLGVFLVDTIEKNLLAAIAKIYIGSLSSIESITTFGAAGIAKAAALTALVKGAANAVRGQLIGEEGIVVKNGNIGSDGVVSGNRHYKGGVQSYLHGIPVEIEGGEFADFDEYGNAMVVNRMATSHNRSLLSRIYGKSFAGKGQLISRLNQKHGGRALAEDGIYVPDSSTGVRNMISFDVSRQFINIERMVYEGAKAGTMEGANRGLYTATERARKLEDLTRKTRS